MHGTKPIYQPSYFYPRPPRGGRPAGCPRRWAPRLFLSTPSARRTTAIRSRVDRWIKKFLSTPSARRTTYGAPATIGASRFLSTPSARRTTFGNGAKMLVKTYFYPRLPQGGRRTTRLYKVDEYRFLSTPSARRATRRKRRCPAYPRYFYPRPPQGGRQGAVALSMIPTVFLSTPSARRATPPGGRAGLRRDISIHALRKEGDRGHRRRLPRRRISIHALRKEGDLKRLAVWMSLKNFYPRPPQGGRRLLSGAAVVNDRISIHALRKEGDIHMALRHPLKREFLSTPSARRATDTMEGVGKSILFLSTPSARRATGRRCLVNDTNGISIHALRKEGDAARRTRRSTP